MQVVFGSSQCAPPAMASHVSYFCGPTAPAAAPPVGTMSARQCTSFWRQGCVCWQCVDDAEKRCFEQQDKLQALLLGSPANVLRGFALSLRGLNRHVEAAAAWCRVLDALEQVIPGSELTAIVANDMLSNKLLAFHLDYHKAAQKELRRALLRSHQAYGGGVETWRFFTSKLFADSVLDGGTATWTAMQKQSQLARGCGEQGYSSKEKPGFEELLRKQAARRTQEKVGSRDGQNAKNAVVPGAKAAPTLSRSHQKPVKEELSSTGTQGPQGEGEGNAASCSVTSEKDSAGLEIIKVVVHLPGLSSAAEASLEVSSTELKVASLRPDVPHRICAVLPTEVETSSSTAKWSRRSQQLTVQRRALRDTAGP